MKTLICIREFPFAEATVRFGGLVAAHLHSDLVLITVMGEHDSRRAAEARLRRGEQLLEVPIEKRKVCKGDPAAEILGEARGGGYELVVLGAQDGVTLLNSLLGTVTTKVAARAQACVLIVNGQRQSLDRILIATSGQLDKDVVKVGARVAQHAGAEVTLLHVTSPVPFMYTGLEAMEERLAELLQSDTPLAEHLRESARYLAEQGVQAKLKLRRGEVIDQILREAREGDYDLLVIGPGPPPVSMHRFLMTEVTPELVERAPTPVLIVREGCHDI